MTKATLYDEDGIRITPLKESASRKGDLAEYYAVTWLWDNGYEVFVNAGCNGPIDMIAFKNNETILVDVKTAQLNAKTNKASVPTVRTAEQKKLGVVFLAFEPTSRKLRWIDHKE